MQWAVDRWWLPCWWRMRIQKHVSRAVLKNIPTLVKTLRVVGAYSYYRSYKLSLFLLDSWAPRNFKYFPRMMLVSGGHRVLSRMCAGAIILHSSSQNWISNPSTAAAKTLLLYNKKECYLKLKSGGSYCVPSKASHLWSHLEGKTRVYRCSKTTIQSGRPQTECTETLKNSSAMCITVVHTLPNPLVGANLK